MCSLRSGWGQATPQCKSVMSFCTSSVLRMPGMACLAECLGMYLFPSWCTDFAWHAATLQRLMSVVSACSTCNYPTASLGAVLLCTVTCRYVLHCFLQITKINHWSRLARLASVLIGVDTLISRLVRVPVKEGGSSHSTQSEKLD